MVPRRQTMGGRGVGNAQWQGRSLVLTGKVRNNVLKMMTFDQRPAGDKGIR